MFSYSGCLFFATVLKFLLYVMVNFCGRVCVCLLKKTIKISKQRNVASWQRCYYRRLVREHKEPSCRLHCGHGKKTLDKTLENCNCSFIMFKECREFQCLISKPLKIQFTIMMEMTSFILNKAS